MSKRLFAGLILCVGSVPNAGAQESPTNPLSHAASIAQRCPNLSFDHKRAQDVAIAMNMPAPPRLRPAMQSARRSMDNVRPARPSRPADPPQPSRESPECGKGLSLYGPEGTAVPGLLSRR